MVDIHDDSAHRCASSSVALGDRSALVHLCAFALRRIRIRDRSLVFTLHYCALSDGARNRPQLATAATNRIKEDVMSNSHTSRSRGRSRGKRRRGVHSLWRPTTFLPGVRAAGRRRPAGDPLQEALFPDDAVLWMVGTAHTC